MLVDGGHLDASCSEKLANVDELTEGIMVVALDALEAAIAAAPGELGADARRRLFATLVAGAVGVVECCLSIQIERKLASGWSPGCWRCAVS